MARYTGPVTRKSRRLRTDLIGGDQAFEKRPYPPGQHGRARIKESEYLLQLQVVLGDDQILLAGVYGALRADDLDRRHGPDLGLTLGIIERFLGIGQRFLLYAHVFVGVDEIPVHVFDLIDGGDYL